MAEGSDEMMLRWRAFVEQRLEAGASRDEIIAELGKSGWTAESGRQLVYWTEDHIREKQFAAGKRAEKWEAQEWHMICGALLFLLGAGMTAMSYATSIAGSPFTLWVGAIVVGVAEFLFGLFGGTKTK